MKKNLIYLILGALFLFPFFKVQAITTTLGFGGKVVESIPCTCPPYGLWIHFAPLFLNSAVPVTGALYYPPTALLYAYYAIGVPSTWELGAFTPGTGACTLVDPAAPVPCPGIPLPALGTMWYVGTSLPGL